MEIQDAYDGAIVRWMELLGDGWNYWEMDGAFFEVDGAIWRWM